MYSDFKLKPIKKTESIEEGFVGLVLKVVLVKTVVSEVIKGFRMNKSAKLFVTDSKLAKAQVPYFIIAKKENVSELTTLDKLEKEIEYFCYKDAKIVNSKENKTSYVIVDDPNKKYCVYASSSNGNQLIHTFSLRDIESNGVKVVSQKEYDKTIEENTALYEAAIISNKENSKLDKEKEIKKIANKFKVKRFFKAFINVYIHPFSFASYDRLKKDLLSLVKGCKNTKEVDYLKTDLKVSITQLNASLSLVKTQGNKKALDNLKDYIYWLKNDYRSALNSKAIELSKVSTNECTLELIDEEFIEYLEIEDIDSLEESMTSNSLSKSYTDSYLYKLNAQYYEKILIEFILKGKEVNKYLDSFKMIESDIKRRQTDSAILKVLQSNNIVLMISGNNVPMPRSFKVFVASDIRPGEDKKKKVFIDVSGLIIEKDGEYSCNQRNIDILIPYLISAATQYIYFADPKRLIMNRNVIKDGANCFAKLFTYVIDYLAKISVNGNLKNKVLYITSLYYINTVLNKDLTESDYKLARDISGLGDREAELTMMQFEITNLKNIKTLVDGLQNIIKKENLTIDVIVNKWLFLYGQGTQFALELFSAFSTMITNAYNGQFLNNQASIEKQCGSDMVKFCKEGIMKIINESI